MSDEIFDEKLTKRILGLTSSPDRAAYEGIVIDQMTGATEPVQGYTSPAGLVMRSESGRTLLIPPGTALELLDSITAVTMSTILRDFLTKEMDDEERARMAQALFDTVERMVETRTHMELMFQSPMVVAGAYMRARQKHYDEHHDEHHDNEEED